MINSIQLSEFCSFFCVKIQSPTFACENLLTVTVITIANKYLQINIFFTHHAGLDLDLNNQTETALEDEMEEVGNIIQFWKI